MPLGMEDGLIDDTQITASSYLDNSSVPWNARLNHESVWTPSRNDNDSWIQVKTKKKKKKVN